MIEDLTGKCFGLWTVLYKDTEKHNTRDVRWICKCKCGNIKSVLGKHLKNNKSVSCGCNKKNDLTGQKFGKLNVLETLYNYDNYKRATYKCACECGNIVYIKGAQINKRKSCGCSTRKNYVGTKFGNLLVEEMLYRYKNNVTYCKCLCDCGNELITRMNGLVSGNTTSCGCMHSPNLLNQKFGRLTVVKEIESCNSQRKWLCRCDCGNIIQVNSYVLTSEHTKSCGCLRSEAVSDYETYIANILKDNNVLYYKEYSFDDCKGVGNKKLRFDFYLPEYNVLIEYDGEQHFKPVKYFGGQEKYNTLKKNDNIKNEYCILHQIKLIRIPYTLKSDEVKSIIVNIIKNPVTTTVA